MKELTLEQMEIVQAGSMKAAVCGSLIVGTGVYVVVALSNSWNPVGWFFYSLLVLDAACEIAVIVSN